MKKRTKYLISAFAVVMTGLFSSVASTDFIIVPGNYNIPVDLSMFYPSGSTAPPMNSIDFSVGSDGSGGISMCVGGGCGIPGPGYSGPIGGSSNPGLDAARRQAFRQSLYEDYQRATRSIQDATNEFLLQKQQVENWKPQEFQQAQRVFLSGLNASLPNLNQTMPPSPTVRTQMNPLPQGLNKTIRDSALQPVWNSIESGEIANTSSEVNRLLRLNAPIEGLPDSAYENQKQVYQHLKRELMISKVLDEQGLLNVPFVEPNGITVTTDEFSEIGKVVRSMINDHLSIKSAVGARCQSGDVDAETCATLQGYADTIDFTLQMLDFAGKMSGYSDPTVEGLEETLNLRLSAAKGLLSAGGDFVTGMIEMASSPIDTTIALGSAIVHLDKTFNALVGGITETWDEFKTADNERRAEILGGLSFEVVTAAVPASKVGWASKVAQRSKTLGQIGKRMGQAAEALHDMGAPLKGQVSTLMKSKLGRSWTETILTGQRQLPDNSFKLFDADLPLNNPFPENGWFAHKTSREFAEQIKLGQGRMARPGVDEAFITAADDLTGLAGQQINSRLALFDDAAATVARQVDLADDVVIYFKMKPASPPTFSPIQFVDDAGNVGRTHGWIPRGRTRGNAREWLIDPNAPAAGIIDLDSIQIHGITKPLPTAP